MLMAATISCPQPAPDRAGGRWTRSAACSAAAPATARSSRRCSTSPGLGLGPQLRRTAAWAPASPKVDGTASSTGEETYGADAAPEDALWLRVVRSPHARARFTLGDLGAALREAIRAGRCADRADVPGSNAFGIYPDLKDQPVLAPTGRRAIAASRCGARRASDATIARSATTRCRSPGSRWPPVLGIEAALAPGAALVQADKPGNVLTARRGR